MDALQVIKEKGYLGYMMNIALNLLFLTFIRIVAKHFNIAVMGAMIRFFCEQGYPLLASQLMSYMQSMFEIMAPEYDFVSSRKYFVHSTLIQNAAAENN